MEKLKKQYEATLKERDIQSEMKDTALNKAAAEIMSTRNEENRKNYCTQITQYEGRIKEYIKEENKKDWEKNGFTAVMHFICVIGLFMLNMYFKPNEDSYWLFKVIGVIVNLLIFIIPFVRPLWKHEAVANAYKFILCQSYRKQLNNEHEKNYRKRHPKPTLILSSIESILQELKDNS